MSEWGTIAVRLGIFADLTLLFGLTGFVCVALSEKERRRALAVPLRPVAGSFVAVALALSGLGLLLLTAGMSGVQLTDLDIASVQTVLFNTGAGAAWIVRMAALVLALGLLFPRKINWPGVLILSGVALGTLAWNGHGAMDEGTGGWIHLAADILHLIAAAAWLGSLLGFLVLLWSSRRCAEHLQLVWRALDSFSAAGTLIVGVIVITGLVNLWFTVGLPNAGAMFSSAYGQLLLVKLALFGMMLLLAALNRFRHTPALRHVLDSGNTGEAVRNLRISIAVEALCGVVVLAVVAWLGTLSPLISAV